MVLKHSIQCTPRAHGVPSNEYAINVCMAAIFGGEAWEVLSKFPRPTLHLSCSDARFGGVHFSGPPHFGPLEIFLVFFAKFGLYGPTLL